MKFSLSEDKKFPDPYGTGLVARKFSRVLKVGALGFIALGVIFQNTGVRHCPGSVGIGSSILGAMALSMETQVGKDLFSGVYKLYFHFKTNN